jgi:histidine triad (HIT) family protein
MTECIFCNIIAGIVPSYMLFEDDDFCVFLDAFPAVSGHTLIVPKVHIQDIFGMPGDVAQRLMPLAVKTANRLKMVLACDGLNMVQNNGAVAGQAVFHFHMHLLPRIAGDGHRVPWRTHPIDASSAKILVEKLSWT